MVVTRRYAKKTRDVITVCQAALEFNPGMTQMHGFIDYSAVS
jgi:hypothetical protein